MKLLSSPVKHEILDVWNMLEFPRHGWKHETSAGDVLEALGYFPPSPVWKLPSGTRRWGGSRSDVWSVERLDLPVRKLLDQHAALTNDRRAAGNFGIFKPKGLIGLILVSYSFI